MKTEQKPFAKNLKAKIRELDLTAEQAAAKLIIEGKPTSVHTFRAWLQGKYVPSTEKAAKIVETFGFDDMYLLVTKNCA